MPNSATAKTKSARSLTAAALCVLLLVMAWGGYRAQQIGQPLRAVLNLGGTRYSLETARTTDDKQRGLGGRSALGKTSGMLFVFDDPSSACMWMKDMRFAIDVLWLDSSRRVITAARNLQPDTYPQTYCAPRPATYVVELPAGALAAAHTKDGSSVDLQID